MKILFVVAHPDDEMISFGPALINALKETEDVTVVCMTKADDNKRNAAFFANCISLGVKPVMVGLQDVAGANIYNSFAVSKLSRLISKLLPNRVFTHCLCTGDRGSNQHHIDTAYMCRAALENVSKLETDYAPEIFHLYHEGYVEKPLVISLGAVDYTRMVEGIMKHYASEYRSLMGNDYPMRNYEMFYTVDNNVFERFLHPGFLASNLNDWRAYDFTPEDPYRTDDSRFEAEKRRRIISTAVSLTCQERKKHRNIFGVDLGTGLGTTTRAFYQASEVDTCIQVEPNITPSVVTDKFLHVRSLKQAHIAANLMTHGPFFIPYFITSFQAYPWIPIDDTLRGFIKHAKFVVIEGDMDDEHLNLLHQNFSSVYTTDFDPLFVVDNKFNPFNNPTGLSQLAFDTHHNITVAIKK